ncbi:hypothetical protein DXG01_009625 [Tephrocybe rancida]|nr:hypothetical protein DXG01_009625 [Tephrocybe rancida]
MAPNHISLADPTAISINYAHGNGAFKFNFYDAFVPICRGVFNTCDLAEHVWKRKIVNHIFSQKSVVEFESHIRLYVKSFIGQWDKLRGEAEKRSKGAEGESPVVQILNGRGEYSMALGVLPPWWRPLARLIPWYRRGAADVKSLAGIAIIAVKRLEAEERGDIGGRVDLLGKMRSSRDAEGREMAREELTAEALTLLIAGSDTTSKHASFVVLTEDDAA